MTDHSDILKRVEEVETIYEQAQEFGVLDDDGVWNLYDDRNVPRVQQLTRPIRRLAAQLAKDVRELLEENEKLVADVAGYKGAFEGVCDKLNDAMSAAGYEMSEPKDSESLEDYFVRTVGESKDWPEPAEIIRQPMKRVPVRRLRLERQKLIETLREITTDSDSETILDEGLNKGRELLVEIEGRDGTD